MSTYAAPLRDMLFTMNEVGGLDAICAQPGHEETTPDLVEAILQEAAHYAAGVLDPLNRTGDVQGARWHDGQVTPADGFREAWASFCENGWNGLPGQVVVVTVPDLKDATSVKGQFLGRTVTLFPNPAAGGTGYIGLLGIDLQDEPGAHELTIDAQLGERARHFSYQVLVVKEKFAVEHLKLPKDKVDLDEKAAARWKAEQEQVRKALRKSLPCGSGKRDSSSRFMGNVPEFSAASAL